MSKEEYAQLCYLLGKLKYSFGEIAIRSNVIMKDFDKICDSIDIITKTCLIDNDEQTKYIKSYKENENE